jgi:hypothetical protein
VTFHTRLKQNGRSNENNLNQAEAYSMDQRIYKNDRWLTIMYNTVQLIFLQGGSDKSGTLSMLHNRNKI